MTKAKFFELLNKVCNNHNARAAEFSLKTLVESEERQAYLLTIGKRSEWLFHSISIVVRDCWHINVQDHKTIQAMNENLKKYSRWLEEWKAAKVEEEKAIEADHEAALAMNAAIDEATSNIHTCVEGARRNTVNQAISNVRDSLVSLLPASFVVAAMSVTSSIAHSKVTESIKRYNAIVAAAATETRVDDSIPF